MTIPRTYNTFQAYKDLIILKLRKLIKNCEITRKKNQNCFYVTHTGCLIKR